MPTKMKPEDALFLGLGLASFTKDRVDDFINFMVKEAKIAKDQAQARKMLMADGRAQYKKMMNTMQMSMDKAMGEVMKAAAKPVKKSSKKKKKK